MRTLQLAALLALPVGAGVLAAAPDSFTVRFKRVAPRPPAGARAALADRSGWWPHAHTFSGKASNLPFEAAGELGQAWEGGQASRGEAMPAVAGRRLFRNAGRARLALRVESVRALAPGRHGRQNPLACRGGPLTGQPGRLAGPANAAFAEAFARLLAHAPPPVPAPAPQET
ncbi:hypothetical protein [Thermaurantiacus sp.]